MSDPNIVQEINDGILTITVNRRRALNSLNEATVMELMEAFERSAGNQEVQAVILTGAGTRAFVSGADIEELSRLGPLDGRETSRKGQALMNRIAAMPKPVAAAINGYALGGGLELAMACALRTAARTAKLGLPEVKLGVIPGFGGTQRLPRLIGLGRALELILTGEMITADEAQQMGLVNKVFEPGELLAGTEKLLRTIMSRGPLAVRFALEAATRGVEMKLEDGMCLEATLFGVLAASEDMREGLTAFVERREPVFKGK
ncbi:MAG: enoyl-CoA hydratase-related protein [Planctomycetota bacterium]